MFYSIHVEILLFFFSPLVAFFLFLSFNESLYSMNEPDMYML